MAAFPHAWEEPGSLFELESGHHDHIRPSTALSIFRKLPRLRLEPRRDRWEDADLHLSAHGRRPDIERLRGSAISPTMATVSLGLRAFPGSEHRGRRVGCQKPSPADSRASSCNRNSRRA
jgi:hypothetical protein